jgi:hypothetical protein
MEKQPIEKIGVGIVTYNSESYFKDLYNSLPKNKIDELLTVNGGERYNESLYDTNWIQHHKNYYPAFCRNDCINFLKNRNCKHIFLIEDDMIIKNEHIFEKYIEASKTSGINYFSFVSMSWDSGSPNNRTPRLTVNYSENVGISFYKNMCNEFTYHNSSCFDEVGVYDTQFRDPFDIDMAYRESKTKYCPPFWWFPDLKNSDDLIENNQNAKSRLQSERPDGSREERIREQWQLFINKHGIMVNEIPDSTQEDVVNFLKSIKNEYSDRN